MTIPYYGDFPTSHTSVVIPFNTFSSNDPTASVTMTDFAATDVHIHKNGSLTQRASSSGIAIDIDVDAIAGNHWITIDLSDNTDAGFYAAGSEISVRVEGVTVDAGTINAFVGAFSIERAGGVLALLKAGTVKVDVETIKTRAVTCGAAVTINPSVGAASIVPTNTQFEARSLPSADYTIVSDLGTVQTADHTAAIAALPSAADNADAVWDEASADHIAAGSTGELLQDIDDEVDAIFIAVESIAVTGSALNITSDGNTLTAGTETSGTYASTEFDNGVYHVITAAGVTIDIEYLFTLPSDAAIPAAVQVIGYLKEGAPAGGDSIALQVYDYVNAGWDTIDGAVFTGIITDGPDVIKNHNLLARHVGTAGADAQKMKIRFYGATLEAGTTLNIDELVVSYAEAISANVALILEDTGTTLPTAIADIPTVAEFNARSLPSADYTIVTDLGVVQTADHTTAIADIPTTAEFEARTIVSADYLVASDTLARVTLVDTTTTNTDMRGTDGANTVVPDAAGTAPTAAEIRAEMESSGSDLHYLMIDQVNKKIITEANGNTEQFSDAGVSLGSISAAYITDGTFTTRKRMVI